jgi:lysophospholipase L1-like esterase
MTLRRLFASSLALASSLSVFFMSGRAAAQSHVTCVGDSITAGIGTSAAPATAYPAMLQSLLGEGFAVENDGHSGATMMVSSDVPYTQVVQFDSSTAWAAAGGDVVIQLGTNDSKAANWTHQASFLGDCEALVRHYQETPGHPRVWLTIVPPASSTACCEIDSEVIASAIVPLLAKCATNTGAVNIDAFTAFTSNMDTLLDGVHPNDDGAAILAKTVYDSLSKTPSVTLTATPDAGAALTLTAAPTAAYGKVEKVVFYDGKNVVTEVTSSPWSFVLDGVTDGSHVFHAETIETAGRKANSPTVTVEVTDGVPVSTITAATPLADDPVAPTSAETSSSGCAVQSSEHVARTMPGALAFGLLALAGLRRSRRR